MNSIGDSHNFGRKTGLRDGVVLKFRDCRGEELLQGPESRLRVALNQISPFGPLLPAAKISPHTGDTPRSWPVTVEALTFPAPTAELLAQSAERIGASIAVILFLGLSDCHYENMLLGAKESSLYFAPLDWETVFGDLTSPYETALFRMRRNCDCERYCRSYGLRSLAGKVDPSRVLCGFEQMRLALVDHRENLDVLLVEELARRPFCRRLVFRDTVDYLRALTEQQFSGFFPEEVVQLERGDVPYFFHRFGETEVLYWISDDSYAVVHSEELRAVRTTRRSFDGSSPLFAAAPLALVRSLDPETEHMTYSNAGITVRYRGPVVFLETPLERSFEKRCR